jgi:hypothetical protein
MFAFSGRRAAMRIRELFLFAHGKRIREQDGFAAVGICSDVPPSHAPGADALRCQLNAAAITMPARLR